MNYLARCVELVGLLNTLAEQSAVGILPFDEYVHSKLSGDGDDAERPIVFDPDNDKLVSDMCIDEIHDDIVGYWDGVFPGVSFKACDDGEGCLFVDVTFEGAGGGVVVEDGRWYVSGFD